jgi:excisionase family DNA binding protein
MQEQMTFNDLPGMVSQILNKVERLERVIETIREHVGKNSSSSTEHIPMTIDEACEFLKMKKSTMYYHVERGNITATRRGKNYIFFKDELLRWLESGRTNQVSLTYEEKNAARMASHKRKPSHPSFK